MSGDGSLFSSMSMPNTPSEHPRRVCSWRAVASESQKAHAGEHDVLYATVFQRVVDDLAVPAGGDDVRRAQQPQLVRAGGLVEPEHPRQIPHAHLRDGEGADDLCARRVRTRSEELREHVQGGVARDIVTDECDRLFVQEGFHARIIILLRARMRAAFGAIRRMSALSVYCAVTSCRRPVRPAGRGWVPRR